LTVKLTEQVLELHKGIDEVFILEESGGQFNVTEKSTRHENSKSPDGLGETQRKFTLAPAVILGAAARFEEEPEALKLVGILYQREGIMLSYLDESKLLQICTDPSSLYEAMRSVNELLPSLIKEHSLGRKAPDAVESAAKTE
jgi:hypothetical protein